MIRLDPPLPVVTPLGPAMAHFLIDYGIEHNLVWLTFIDATGECWSYDNTRVRLARNHTMGRDCISPFYNPDDVALNK